MVFLTKDSARVRIPENNLITMILIVAIGILNPMTSYSFSSLFGVFFIIASLELIVMDKIKVYMILSTPQKVPSLGMRNVSLILYIKT